MLDVRAGQGPLPPSFQGRIAEISHELEGWKRVAVIAAIPLEAMRMSGGYRALSPAVQQGVDEAVVTIRMALLGRLPPKGDVNAGLVPARAALAEHKEPSNG